MEQFGVTLERFEQLSPATLEFRFVRDDGKPVEFIPGQFFRFTFTDAEGEFERSYSLCNHTADCAGSRYLDLVISAVEKGRATSLLFDCAPGIQAAVTGPYGRLVLPEPLPARIILVATSVGIAPYLPMLAALETALASRSVEVVLLFGVRDPAEFIYATYLVDLMSRHAGFDLRVCYSRRMPTVVRDFERQGYVQEEIERMAIDPAEDFFMLCGNPGMVASAFASLKSRGLTHRRVLREPYVFAKVPGKSAARPLTEAQRQLIADKMKKFQ